MELRKDPITRSWVITGDDVPDAAPRVETFCRTKEIGYHRMTSDSPVESFVLAQLRGRVVA